MTRIFKTAFITAVSIIITASQGFTNELLKPVNDSITNRYSSDVTRTRWVDPSGGHPITFQKWTAQTEARGEWKSSLVWTNTPKSSYRNLVGFGIFIDSALYDQIQASINLYALDLTGEGYDVKVYSICGGNPSDLRAFINDKYLEGMAGCVFIGDLPVAWYETDFGDPPSHAEFPIDLYYMDLDGIFTDSDVDGMYDSHIGDVTPEIWMGRLTASPLTMDGANEIDLLVDYFDRNHQYRCGLLPLNNKALVYIDDDWEPGSSWWNMNVGEAYANREFVNDKWTTWSPDYESRLPNNYGFIQVCAHSWPEGHAFKNPDDNWSYTYNSEVKGLQPVSHFYNLFACSNARYVEENYMSGWYIFGQEYGLAAIGSTKSGSMLAFEDFYHPFGEGKGIGQAYFDWFSARAAGGFEEWEITWFYGMTLNGDPTLTIQQKSASTLLQYDDGSAAYMMSLSPSSDKDMFNVRFTPEMACTLSSVTVEGDFSDSLGVRMYVWASDGTYPTMLIDSLDIPDGDLSFIDISKLNLYCNANEDFHIGFSPIESATADTLWIYMDDGQQFPEHRSGLSEDSIWKTLDEFYGSNHNFLIRVEVRHEPEPEVTITTLTIPDGEVGQSYSVNLEATDGTPPYVWDITDGSLPDGLNLDPESGVLSGVPSKQGTFNFTVRATDSHSPAESDVQHLYAVITQACGDINANGEGPNVSDITYLVSYLFTGGP
ncbi:MAG: Ig domain-containing protein, partial [candidate division Zixibacteria bacterium]|nr:Ig domain-containing protein [candidate division Zixibacteria bacterium]